jgi:hypothetical protein
MERFVKLDRLPAGFGVPGAFSDRFRFDPDTGHLCFRGFMSKGDFDRLYLLSDDWSYRRTLEELFRICTLDDEPPTPTPLRRVKRLLSSLGLA